MQLIRGIRNLKQKILSCVITIGNFDGMHLGHQQLIQALIKTAKEKEIPSVLLTFEPQPNEFFNQEPPARLMRMREKYTALKNAGVDYLLVERFDRAFSKISAKDFLENILLKQLGMQAIIIGDDFRFGANRQGDKTVLEEMNQPHHFDILEMPTLLIKDARVSSTRIRHALQNSNFSEVQQLLGRPYSLCGKVSYGHNRGQALGFPTANINLHRKRVPLTGVYAIRALGIANQPIEGVANVGIRPTFDGTRVLLEAHLFNFNQKIYGKMVEIQFLHKIRNEKRFEKMEDLMAQIAKDVLDAKNYFESLPLLKTTGVI